jgi:hypothetical protein
MRKAYFLHSSEIGRKMLAVSSKIAQQLWQKTRRVKLYVNILSALLRMIEYARVKKSEPSKAKKLQIALQCQKRAR